MRILGVILLAPAAGLLGSVQLSAAATQQAVQQDAEAPDSPASTTIICRRFPPPTGSRIGARNVCKTEHEWALIDEENADNLMRAARTRPNCSAHYLPCGS